MAATTAAATPPSATCMKAHTAIGLGSIMTVELDVCVELVDVTVDGVQVGGLLRSIANGGPPLSEYSGSVYGRPELSKA
jgi:hypothetical protein